MVPTLLRISQSPRLLLTLASVVAQHVPNVLSSPAGPANASGAALHAFSRRDEGKHNAKFIAFACLIPILVLLSGVFAGLTLGYMSLDETQLNVLSISGTPYALRAVYRLVLTSLIVTRRCTQTRSSQSAKTAICCS